MPAKLVKKAVGAFELASTSEERSLTGRITPHGSLPFRKPFCSANRSVAHLTRGLHRGT